MGADSLRHHLRRDNYTTFCGRNASTTSVKNAEEWSTIWSKAKCKKCESIRIKQQ